MQHANYDSVLSQLRAAGLLVDGLTIGRMTRCRVEGRDREARGWYMLHELQASGGDLLIVGSFGIWQGNNNNAQKIDLEKSEVSAEQRESLRKRLAEDRKRVDRARKDEGERAAKRAAKAWTLCSPTGDSDYLKRKGVGAHGLRFSPSGAIVIPMLDTSGQVHGLQIIRSPREAKASKHLQKEFWPKGLLKKGHFHLIGIPSAIVLVAEGYATGASLHEATGLPVAVAFDAGNLAPVASALRKRYKLARILICADDDSFTDGNPGVSAASAAAIEVNGAFTRPVFADELGRQDKHAKRGIKITDFNDLHAIEGLHVVRTQIEARISELGWSTTSKRGASTSRAGDGGNALRPIESLDELLERYALVYGQGGVVFDRQEHCLVKSDDVRDACIARPLHRAWADHPERAIVRVREVGFDPGNEDPAIKCNLWGGWPTTAKAGQCDKLLELLRHMCSADTDSAKLYHWVLCWLAYPIQHPGAKLKTALVLHGPQGTGKNMFFEAIMSIYGQYGRVIDQSAVEDKYNDWASRKLFLIADEVVARSDLYHVKNKLKALITGEWIRINPKHVTPYDERNHVNFVFLSNEAMPVVLEEDDRRHAVIWTPHKLPPGFYAEVNAEINSGGIAALHDYLLNFDTGDFTAATAPPKTAAKDELINLGLDSTSRFYYALMKGEIGPPDYKPVAALAQDIYESYAGWCRKTGASRPAPLPRLVNALKRKHNVTPGRSRWIDAFGTTQGPHSILLLGDAAPDPGETATGWFGKHIAAYKSAMGDAAGSAA